MKKLQVDRELPSYFGRKWRHNSFFCRFYFCSVSPKVIYWEALMLPSYFCGRRYCVYFRRRSAFIGRRHLVTADYRVFLPSFVGGQVSFTWPRSLPSFTVFSSRWPAMVSPALQTGPTRLLIGREGQWGQRQPIKKRDVCVRDQDSSLSWPIFPDCFLAVFFSLKKMKWKKNSMFVIELGRASTELFCTVVFFGGFSRFSLFGFRLRFVLPRLCSVLSTVRFSWPPSFGAASQSTANQVLLGFTGFYRVLRGVTGFYWVLLGFTWRESETNYDSWGTVFRPRSNWGSRKTYPRCLRGTLEMPGIPDRFPTTRPPQLDAILINDLSRLNSTLFFFIFMFQKFVFFFIKRNQIISSLFVMANRGQRRSN